jgi:hypothetical protein
MENQNLSTRHYDLNDIGISFTSNNDFIHSAIARLLSRHARCRRDGESGLRIRLFDRQALCELCFGAMREGKPMCATSENDDFDIRRTGLTCLELFRGEIEGSYYLSYGNRGGIGFDPKRGLAEGYFLDPDSMEPFVIAGYVFLFVLNRLMESRGHFFIHCASVARDGRGILIPGFSGAGKTTTCIALARGGFDFLCDDRGFLRRDGEGGPRFIAFAEDVDVTERTLDFFPEIRAHAGFRYRPGGGKKSFRMEDVYPVVSKSSCLPRAILFPQLSENSRSTLSPISKNEAMRLFLPHSMLVTDKGIAREHFEILFDLINSARCYRLCLGLDFDSLPNLAATVL